MLNTAKFISLRDDIIRLAEKVDQLVAATPLNDRTGDDLARAHGALFDARDYLTQALGR